MRFVYKLAGLAGLVFWAARAWADEPQSVGAAANVLEVRTVSVEGKAVTRRAGRVVSLGPFPENVSFAFGPASNSTWAPIRLHYKLESYDAGWRRGLSEMTLTIRFYSSSRDIVDQKVFKATGDSTDWKSSLKTSTLTHRRETIKVPPRASLCMAVMSSAGPPSAVGVYVIDDLVLSRICPTDPSPQVLLRTPADLARTESATSSIQGWVRDGTRPSMAKIVELGQEPKIKALGILDDDPIGHAEWRTSLETAPTVAGGDLLVVEWNELYSVGVADTRSATYQRLPPGDYQFRVQEETIFGVPTGVEAALGIRVAAPLWGRPWFWTGAAALLVASSAAGARYRASYKLRRELQRLQHQRELEQERLRIARDIHDDLGARVTQISMLSAMAPDNSSFPQNARADFDRISQMSRDLISALYETVWAVSPENDNLYALGNYLRQITSQLCELAQLRCRLHIPTLPREVPVSSQTRHNITMAVNEAVHNVIKHANAAEVIVRVTFAGGLFTVSIEDNGCGFQAGGEPSGNGLVNMKRRLEDLGGSCVIESEPRHGTSVHLRLTIEAAPSKRAGNPVPDSQPL
jgi:signal transduction histidine kinase